MSPLARSLLAGAAAGIVGVAVFLTIHHFWILPIWSIAVFGVPFAAATGAAVGWAAHEARAKLPRGRLSLALSLSALLLVTLVPAQLFATGTGPVIDITDPEPDIPAGFVVPAILAMASAIPVGAALGWWLTRSRRGVAAWALAGLATALGVGHNVPFVGGLWPAAAKMWTIMAAAQLAAALVYVFGRER